MNEWKNEFIYSHLHKVRGTDEFATLEPVMYRPERNNKSCLTSEIAFQIASVEVISFTYNNHKKMHNYSLQSKKFLPHIFWDI